MTDATLAPDQVARIATDLNVSQKEVANMNSRLLQGDTSLNNPVGEEDDGKEMVDLIASASPSQEQLAIEHQEKSRQENAFKKAFATLNEREKDILTKRQMSENSLTLEELSQIYGVSRERIRQIEESAIKKIKKEIARCSQA